jgi:hypothetical protein
MLFVVFKIPVNPDFSSMAVNIFGGGQHVQNTVGCLNYSWTLNKWQLNICYTVLSAAQLFNRNLLFSKTCYFN